MARIVLPNGTECYMKRDRISLTYFESGVDSLIDHLNHFLGVEYLWGGTTPYGFDCSGLLYRVGRMHGYDLSRDSADQALQDVEVEEPQRGDMLFFGSGERITHVALYLGGEKMIHAAGSGGGSRVTVSFLRDYEDIVGYKQEGVLMSAHPGINKIR